MLEIRCRVRFSSSGFFHENESVEVDPSVNPDFNVTNGAGVLRGVIRQVLAKPTLEFEQSEPHKAGAFPSPPHPPTPPPPSPPICQLCVARERAFSFLFFSSSFFFGGGGGTAMDAWCPGSSGLTPLQCDE